MTPFLHWPDAQPWATRLRRMRAWRRWRPALLVAGLLTLTAVVDGAIWMAGHG